MARWCGNCYGEYSTAPPGAVHPGVFGAADRIRTCGLSGRSRTIYPAELQPHIYENRRWDEIHRMKFCESLE